MADDHARQAQAADEPWPAPIQPGDRAQHPQVLDQHVEHGDPDHRADRRHHADALGRGKDGAPRFLIERHHQLAVGERQEVAGLQDRAFVLGKARKRPGEVGAAFKNAGQVPYGTALARKVALFQRFLDLCPEAAKPCEPKKTEQLAQHDDQHREPQ